MRLLPLLLLALPLAGCDKLTGAAEQKIVDAEAIGFACRVSQKTPEACMKENEANSPSSILDGWKSADADIKAGKLDPSMGKGAQSKIMEPDAAAAEAKPADDVAAPAEAKKDGAVTDAEAAASPDKAPPTKESKAAAKH